MTDTPLDDAPDERAAAKLKAEVSDETFAFKTFTFTDPIVTAAQIADRFGAHPLSDFKVLQLLPNGEIESMRPTETANLREEGRERFFVIRSDRTYSFTVDSLSLEWALSTIPGAHLRELARADDRHDLVRVTRTGFEPVEEEDIVSFTGEDTDEFRLVKVPKTVTVRYRETDFELERRMWTTEQLIERFGVPTGHKLDLIKPYGEFKELKPGGKLQVREGMEFTSHVPVGQSS